MHKNTSISIIIPVYNSSLYIGNCLDSILSQDFKDFELILIDDGSTDNSPEICKTYQQRDGRIKILKKDNGGQGSARNLGLKISIGKYIMFIDSDDAIGLNTLQRNFEILNANPSIECLQYPLYRNYSAKDAYIVKGDNTFYAKEDDFKKLLLKQSIVSWIVCDKMIKRDVLNGMYFPEDIIYEDNYFMLNLIEKLNSIYISDKGMYYYYKRENSTTTSKFTLKGELSTLKVLLKTLSLLNFSDNRELMLKYLIRLINVDKSLKINFNYFHDEVEKYKDDLNLVDVVFNNLNMKEKFKLAIYKWF